MELTIKINTEDNLDLDCENCAPFINEPHFKEVVGYAV